MYSCCLYNFGYFKIKIWMLDNKGKYCSCLKISYLSWRCGRGDMAAACMSKSVFATSGILAIREIAAGKIAASVTGKMAMAYLCLQRVKGWA